MKKTKNITRKFWLLICFLTVILPLLAQSSSYLYFIKTSDKDGAGVKYFLNTAAAQKVVSINNDDNYEGFIDLTATNWDNIGLIKSDLSVYYSYNGGWSPSQSSGSFTLVEVASPGTGYYPSEGPWADWKWYNSNAGIVSPGVWRIRYNALTRLMDLVETQFAINGTAIAARAMTYNSSTKRWTVTADLVAGTFHFITIPVSSGDPTIILQKSSKDGGLSYTGTDITISKNSNYTITLNLSDPANYSYTIVDNIPTSDVKILKSVGNVIYNNGSIHISSGFIKADIFSVDGKHLRSVVNTNEDIDTSSLTKAVYIVLLKDKQGKEYAEKLQVK